MNWTVYKTCMLYAMYCLTDMYSTKLIHSCNAIVPCHHPRINHEKSYTRIKQEETSQPASQADHSSAADTNVSVSPSLPSFSPAPGLAPVPAPGPEPSNPTPTFLPLITAFRHFPTPSKSPNNPTCPRSLLTNPSRIIRYPGGIMAAEARQTPSPAAKERSS